jgi:hypothetical protein
MNFFMAVVLDGQLLAEESAGESFGNWVLVKFENSSASKPSSDGFPEMVSSPALLALGPAGLDGSALQRALDIATLIPG